MSTGDRTNPAFTADTHRSWWPVLGVHRGPESLIIAEETTMRELADGLRLPVPNQWRALISPAAVADGDGVRMDSELTLGAFGAVPGATLTLRRIL
jgi:hypothetical protein